MGSLSDSMSKIFIKTPETSSSDSQVRALRMPNEKEIKQAHLNIKMGNRQLSEVLRKQHGMECHYCKSQGLNHIGHWVSTCPIIRDILKLEKAPLPMAANEPAICAVTGDRTASMVDTGSQVHLPYCNLVVNNVLYCKDVEGTLLSLGQFLDEGFGSHFAGKDMNITKTNGDIFCTATFANRGWVISPIPLLPAQSGLTAFNSKSSYEWHCRLGHVSDKIVKQFLKLYVPALDQKSWLPFFCEHCSIAKSTRRQLQASPWDVMGPLPTPDIHQNKYILTLRDHVRFLKDSVKFLQSDNAKEYSGQNFRISLTNLGTQQLFTSPYTPEQNGEAERLNRTLGYSARTMLRASGLPTSFWSYAYKCAAYIHNRIPNSRTGGKSPLEMWCGRKSQPFRIFPFGAKAVVHIPSEKRGKLDDRGRIFHLIGFQDDSRGYFFGDNGTQQVINSNFVKFLDFDFNNKDQNEKMSIPNLLNSVTLQLGQERTDEICNLQDNQIANLES
ncbi:hypothetical protein O181_011056 [Austropuccinia psidii MF-1]|uniref:Integrase catalytic domain-containing protein n=1 Tax=Austropuccinia psidii MF-1 TaxID=1389203 RepID=A0A9Q3GKZ7_9BASI|nr:hypothetical protein [Austropuccinia psidii MF-1]